MNAEPKCRLGIYGGTFAPPHIGHVQAARDFLNQARLHKLLIMPAFLPPHKQVDAGDDPALRLKMTEAAFEREDPRIQVSDYEIQRGGTSYTWQTLTHFRETTESELYFLCGTDMFLSLEQWRYPDIIFREAVIACVMRETDPDAYRAVREKETLYKNAYGARTVFIDSTPIRMSSTEIRDAVRRGEDISHCVPGGVLRLIKEHALYQ